MSEVEDILQGPATRETLEHLHYLLAKALLEVFVKYAALGQPVPSPYLHVVASFLRQENIKAGRATNPQRALMSLVARADLQAEGARSFGFDQELGSKHKRSGSK